MNPVRIGDATLYEGDCRDVLPTTLGQVDAVVCDPPYHLQATVKRFGDKEAAAAKGGRDGSYKRLSGGFMGQKWDGGDIAFRPETWALVLQAVKPGGFLLSFGGTRTWHRMACAIEDAGFIIQDTIAWLYGSGFPKQRDMLKPAFEPVIMAYRPGGKRELQIDECRIASEGHMAADYIASNRNRDRYRTGVPVNQRIADFGRWPANVCHDGSDEVMDAFPEAPGQFASVRGSEPSNSTRFVYNDLKGRHSSREPVGDIGSAARFFYCAKADKKSRFGSRHPTVKPVALMQWLVKLVTPRGGTVLDPFAGSGTTGEAALSTGRKAILIEREPQYCADIVERLQHCTGEGRHSMAAINRNTQEREPLPLFAPIEAATE